MIEKNNLDKTNAWPFVEAKKILRERKKTIEKKNKIILQTGYGPSGLPHIGTFGEVVRTSMVVNALNQLKPPFNVSRPALFAASAAVMDTVWLKKEIKHVNKWSKNTT